MLYLKKEGDAYVKIDKMKKRIPIFTLFKSLGLSRKKIIMSTKNSESLEKLNQIGKSSIQKSLIKLSEIITEKESNILRIIGIS